MKVNFEELERIAQIYNRFRLEERQKNVGNGFWKPTPFEILLEEMKFISILAYKNKIEERCPVLVAGSGDARRAAYLNNLSYDVTAVEINPRLVEYSRDITDKLAQEKLVKKDRLKILQGDFLDDNVYQKGERKFGDFDIYFAYLVKKNLEKLSNKISEKSKKGSSLFVLSPVDWEDPYFNLQNVEGASITIKGLAHRRITRYVKRFK